MSLPLRTKHIHTYERLDTGNFKGNYYRCIDPECAHYIRKELALGKRALCTCGKEYVLTKYHLERKRPNCDECKIGKPNAKVPESIKNEVIKDRLMNIFDLMEGKK